MQLTRRQFLAGMAAGAVAAAVGVRVRPMPGVRAAEGVLALDATAQAEAIRKGEISAVELLDETIRRIEAVNPKVNAIVTECFDRARDRAKAGDFSGPFAGVPFAIKDLNDVAGVRTTHGCRAMMQNIAKTSHAYVKASESAGLNIVGKTNTPEFGLEATTESLALGPCLNPWNTAHSSGGSSGGAGAAVAAGLLPMAHANDGGGSIRIPSSCCGLFGLKTSRGRQMGEGNGFSLAVQGVISRSVRDTARMLAATERETPAPGLERVGFVEGPSTRRLKIGMYLTGGRGEQPEPDVAEAIQSTAALCKELGHEVGEAKFTFDSAESVEQFLILWSSGAGAAYEEFEAQFGRKPTDQDFEPLTMAFVDQYLNGGKEKLAGAVQALMRITGELFEQAKSFDVLLCPVLRSAPPLIGEQAPTVPFDVLIERMKTYVAYTPLHNSAGMPAISVPLAWNAQGLPIGSQFAAKPGGERTLLELAYELEAARPWAQKRPAIG